MVVGQRGGGGRRWTCQRGCWVLRGPRGFGCLTGGGPEVVTHGGSVTASTVAAKGWRRKKVLHGGGAPLYRRHRRLEKGAVSYGQSGGGGEAMGTVKQRRPRSKRGCHVRCHCSDRAADGWVQRFQILSNLSKTSSILKIKMGALSYSKNSEFLDASRRKYWEQLVQLC
jgi:hypothetical protein